MNIKEIVEDYLKKNGFDGLYDADENCGCFIGELFTCGQPQEKCIPGYKAICQKKCNEFNGCIFSKPGQDCYRDEDED